MNYLSEDSIFTRGVQSGVVTVLHGKATVDVKAGHEVRLTGLRVLQALGDEGRAALGQQQELLYALQGSTKFEERGKKRVWHGVCGITKLDCERLKCLHELPYAEHSTSFFYYLYCGYSHVTLQEY